MSWYSTHTLQLPPGYIEQLQAELAQCRGCLATRDAELIQLRRDYSKLRSFNKEYHQAYETLQHERNGLSRELENTTDLSNARGKELAGAQVFLSKADNISVVEVKDLVDALNEEIFQTAASLGDCVVRRKYGLSDEDCRSSIKRLRPIVGKGFLQILSAQSEIDSNRRDANPLLVQVIAQVVLVDRCKYEVDQWDPNRPNLSDGLAELYRGMRGSGVCSSFLRDLC
jgi:exonuclease VII large subunit